MKNNNREKTTLRARLSPELYEWFKQYAEANETTRSAIVRGWVVELRKREERINETRDTN